MSEGTNQPVNAYHRRPSGRAKLIVIHASLLSRLLFATGHPSDFQMPRKNNARGGKWTGVTVVVHFFGKWTLEKGNRRFASIRG